MGTASMHSFPSPTDRIPGGECVFLCGRRQTPELFPLCFLLTDEGLEVNFWIVGIRPREVLPAATADFCGVVYPRIFYTDLNG